MLTWLIFASQVTYCNKRVKHSIKAVSSYVQCALLSVVCIKNCCHGYCAKFKIIVVVLYQHIFIYIYTMKGKLWWSILSKVSYDDQYYENMSWVDNNSTTSTEVENTEHKNFRKLKYIKFMITTVLIISGLWY